MKKGGKDENDGKVKEDFFVLRRSDSCGNADQREKIIDEGKGRMSKGGEERKKEGDDEESHPKTYGNRFFPQRVWRANRFSCFAILSDIFASTNKSCRSGELLSRKQPQSITHYYSGAS